MHGHMNVKKCIEIFTGKKRTTGRKGLTCYARWTLFNWFTCVGTFLDRRIEATRNPFAQTQQSTSDRHYMNL